MSAPDPQTRTKLETLRGVGDRIHHVHAMVERFATARDVREAETYSVSLKRELGRFKRDLASKGFDILAQKAGDMQVMAGRRGSQGNKSRMMREAVANLRNLADLEKRRVASSARRAQRAEEPEPTVPDD